MKKLYTLLLFYALAMPLAGQEEPCPPTGVTTNPDEPLNDLHPFYRNEYFDWRVFEYNAQLDQNELIRTMPNPNEYPGGGVYHLAGNGDYLPEDGWELLSVDLGLDRNGNWNPLGSGGEIYIILYNKYRSLIRVFLAIAEVPENNLVNLRLRLNGGYNTAIFASIDKVQQPLKHFDPSIVASNTQKFYNSGEGPPNWFYADFPVNYDPCTCVPVENQTSEILVEAYLLREGQITLEGSSGGTIKIDKQSSTSSSNDKWKDFYGTVKDVGGTIKAGRKGYKDFNVFKKDVKSTADSTSASSSKKTDMKSGIDNLGGFLTDNIPGLEFVPYASEALAIIDFFVSGGKKEGPTKVIFPPMSIQLEHSFSGSLSFASPYVLRGIYTPGSIFTPQNNTANGDPKPNGDEKYPVYNEILGVYTLLDVPKVEIYGGFVTQKYGAPISSGNRNITRKLLKVDGESIKIALNPASGLTVAEAYLQLNVELSTSSTEHIISSSGGTVVNDQLWVSSLIPLGCADNNPVIIDEEMWGVGFSPVSLFSLISDLSLSTILVLENSAGDRFIHKGTWVTDYTMSDYPYNSDLITAIGPHVTEKYNWFDKQLFMNYNTRFLNAEQNLNLINRTVLNDTNGLETILIQNSTINVSNQAPSNNVYTKLLAGETIEILPNSEVLPNSDLQISRFGINCNAPIDLATAEQIDSICTSSEYQSQRILDKKQIEPKVPIAKEIAQLNFITYPNPAQEHVLILLESGQSYPEHLEITLVDVSGNPVQKSIIKSTELNGNKYPLDLQGLAPGMYVLRVNAENISGQRKIVKL